MNLSALPALLRTLMDAPQDWMEDGHEVNGELTLRSNGTTLGPGRKKGTWSPMEATSTGPLIVEATIGGVEHTIRYDVPTEKGGFITGIVLEPAREPKSRCRAQKEYVPTERGANGAGGTSDGDREVGRFTSPRTRTSPRSACARSRRSTTSPAISCR